MTIESRLERLEDIEEIKQLKAKYCRFCDEGYDPDGIAGLFTEFGMEVAHSAWLKVEPGYDDTLKVRVAESPSRDIR